MIIFLIIQPYFPGPYLVSGLSLKLFWSKQLVTPHASSIDFAGLILLSSSLIFTSGFYWFLSSWSESASYYKFNLLGNSFGANATVYQCLLDKPTATDKLGDIARKSY